MVGNMVHLSDTDHGSSAGHSIAEVFVYGTGIVCIVRSLSCYRILRHSVSSSFQSNICFISFLSNHLIPARFPKYKSVREFGCVVSYKF